MARIGKVGQFLGTNPQQPFKTIQEMVAFAKANPGKLSYGHGNASAQIIGETIKHKLDLNIVRVPYSSNPTALTDLLSNNIQTHADRLSERSSTGRNPRRIVALAVGHQGPLPEAAEHADAARDGDPGFRSVAVDRLVRSAQPAAQHRRANVRRARQDRIERNVRQEPGEDRPRAILPAERAVCRLCEG